MDVVLYTVGHPCPLCDEARLHLDALGARIPFRLRTVVVDHDPRLAVRYALRVPVLEIDGVEAMFGRIDPVALEHALVRAATRPAPRPQGPPSRVDSAPEDLR